MKDDRFSPKKSLAGSASLLWRGSAGWKLALLGATICTGLYLLDPPWGSSRADRVSTPATQQSSAAVQTIAREALQSVDEGLTSEIAAADQNCGAGSPMRVALNPPAAVAGRIEGFLSEAEAMALIPRSEEFANGRIDPAYVHNLRALFHPDAAPPNVRVPVLVPVGMDVRVGEHVEMVGGHASPNSACHYVPNLLTGVVTGR